MSQANRRSLWTFTVLLALTLAAAAALSIWGREEAAPASSDAAVPASANWGLSFQNEGQAPAGNASREDLAKYGAYFLGDTSKKVLYLTFDCGYENGYTGQILDALKKHRAPAAFFVVGHMVESAPDIPLLPPAPGQVQRGEPAAGPGPGVQHRVLVPGLRGLEHR